MSCPTKRVSAAAETSCVELQGQQDAAGVLPAVRDVRDDDHADREICDVVQAVRDVRDDHADRADLEDPAMRTSLQETRLETTT